MKKTVLVRRSKLCYPYLNDGEAGEIRINSAKLRLYVNYEVEVRIFKKNNIVHQLSKNEKIK